MNIEFDIMNIEFDIMNNDQCLNVGSSIKIIFQLIELLHEQIDAIVCTS